MQKIQKDFYVLNGKEYTLEQLDQLRTEYNFLVSDIQEKQNNKEKLELDIVKSIEIIQKAKQDREQEKNTIIFENEKLKKYLQDKIDVLDIDIKQKESDNRKMSAEIKIQQQSLDAKWSDLVRDNRLLLDDKAKFEDEKKLVLSDIDAREKQLKSDSKKAKEKLEEGLRLLKEYDAKKLAIQGWEERYKKQNDELQEQREDLSIKWAVVEKNKKENEIQRKQLDKDLEKNSKLLQEIETKGGNLAEKMDDLKTRGWELAKNITEFRETKYQFLVIMKQKGISKLDIDKLDKEFSI